MGWRSGSWEEFCRYAVACFNADPDAEAAANGWTLDFGLVVERDGEALCAYVGPPTGGRLPAPVFLDEAALSARAPQWLARASEETWQALLEGRLDPIEAIVQKGLEVRGDLQPVLERLSYRGLALRWLEQLKSWGS